MNSMNIGTRRNGSSSLFARLRFAIVPAILCALVISAAAGCSNGKCKSCLFGGKDKELIDQQDSTTLGQSQSDPKPPTSDEISGVNLEAKASQPSNSTTIPPTKIAAATPATTAPAADSKQRIENAASSAADAASVQPTLEAAQPAAAAAAEQPQQYQSVAPAPATTAAPAENQSANLGFAPSTQDHASNLSAEVKNDAAALPAAPNTGAQIAPDKATRPEPIPAAESTSPANAPDTIEDVLAAAPTVREPSWLRSQMAINAAADNGPRVNLKGQVKAMTNTAATANAVERQTMARPATPAPTQAQAPAAPATTAPAATAQTTPAPAATAPAATAPAAPRVGNLIPNGQVSSIIPGMQLGVIDLTK